MIFVDDRFDEFMLKKFHNFFSQTKSKFSITLVAPSFFIMKILSRICLTQFRKYAIFLSARRQRMIIDTLLLILIPSTDRG